MAQTVTYKLSEEIHTHKGPTREIVLQEPRARAFRLFGEPFKVIRRDDRIDFEFDNDAMLKFIGDMSGLDAVILDGLSANDYIGLRAAATGLFAGIGDNPTNPSLAP